MRRNSTALPEAALPAHFGRRLTLVLALTLAAFVSMAPAAMGAGDRAFELVSPANGGIDVNIERTGLGSFSPSASADGEGIAFSVPGALPGSGAGTVFNAYLSRRSADGWSTDSLSPAQNPAPFIGWSAFWLFTEDLERAVISGPESPQPAPGASEGSHNLFLFDIGNRNSKTITVGGPENFFFWEPEPVGASDDLSTVAFKSDWPLVEGAPGRPNVLYQWSEATGELDLVGRMPGSNAPITDDEVLLASRVDSANAVSSEGSRIFFRAESIQSTQLYVRIDGSQTRHVSASRATVPDPNGTQDATFRWAKPDGSTVFFTSGEKLTDDATTGPTSSGSDLYRYDVDTDELTDLTIDPGDPNGAEVQGVLGASRDGEHLYFVARGVLAPGATLGETNLYRWSDDGTAKGAIEYVTTGVDPANWEPDVFFERIPSRVTPDGNTLLFTSTASLTGFPTAGFEQAYLYHADTDQLECASCNPLGGPSTADVMAYGTNEIPHQGRTLTPDGHRVFYSTVEKMSAEDENSVADVYEYDSVTGQVELVSSGIGQDPSLFQDAGVDGRDVFFLTRARLVGVDRDEARDVYNARIGGGFASQNPLASPPCGPAECRAVLPPPTPVAPGSVFQGPGNQVQKPKKHRKHKHRGKKHRSKKHKKKKGKQNRHGKRHASRR